MRRGEIWWAELPVPAGSEPGFTRPVLIVQSDEINSSNLATVIVLSLTSNLKYKRLRGCIFLSANETGLSKDSVVNTTQVVTLSKSLLSEQAGEVPDEIMIAIDDALRETLSL